MAAGSGRGTTLVIKLTLAILLEGISQYSAGYARWAQMVNLHSSKLLYL